MTDVVERVRTALEGITRGPWKLKVLKSQKNRPEVVHTPKGCLWHPSLGFINNLADGEFIAAARTLVPELVAEVEELRRQLSVECTAAANAEGALREHAGWGGT